MAMKYKHNIISKYKAVKPVFKGGLTNYASIDSTRKWVEYTLDMLDLNNLILVEQDWDVKMDLRFCLTNAESKKEWHQKHPNFDSKRARLLYDTVKHLPRKDAQNNKNELNDKYY
jgi:hypothetical protein